jgi:hypothetical protein
MRLAVVDPFCGISGNMMLGALLDAGLDRDRLEGALRRLPLAGWRLEVSQVARAGLRGTLVEVVAPPGGPHRSLKDISGMISSAGLPDRAAAGSIRAFEMLAGAEARVHGCPVDEVHFHEVGAADAIIDITGAFLGLDLLGVDEVRSSPVATGYGTVVCAHGILPVPAPATALLLEGIPCFRSEVQGELTTPTGAAILRAAVSSWDVEMPPHVPEAVGMGAGSREMSCPNLLRVTLARLPGKRDESSEVLCELVTVVDDMDPRLWPELEKSLMAAGALDVCLIQCIGRKGRPAVEVTVLCHVELAPVLRTVIYTRTPTLGIRARTVERDRLAREIRDLETRFGKMRIKLSFMDGKPLRAEPEFADCAGAAQAAGLPAAAVLEEVRNLARSLLEARKG